MNLQEARTTFTADKALLIQHGVSWDERAEVVAYLPDEFRRDYRLAMDAIPALGSDPNAGIPSYLSMFVDPTIYKWVFAPNSGAKILGERRQGDWTQKTAMFPVVEYVGEVSSYNDYSENGNADVNANFPQRQAYNFQTMKQLGDHEIAVAGLARLNMVAEKDAAATMALDKFMNLTYFFGVKNLQNYGLLNDPNLSASLTPTPKANGGNAWFTSGNAPNATANEVYNDILNLYEQLVAQCGGALAVDDDLVLGLPPILQAALKFTNAFGLTVGAMLKDNFPKLRIEAAVQYGQVTTANPYGVAAGNMVQMIAEKVEGQQTGYCSFNEKLRTFPIVRGTSNWKQKMMAGSWGAIIRAPFALASMVGC
jgi:hypothetical protein